MAQIRLDSNAFRHNIQAISNALKNALDSSALDSSENLANALKSTNLANATKPPKLALVMKDNAYGHGLLQIANLAKENNIDCVFVKNYAEALQVQRFFAHITVLYGGVPFDAPSNIYVSIASLDSLKMLEKQAQNLDAKSIASKNPPLGIELKCNIGMNRNGIQVSNFAQKSTQQFAQDFAQKPAQILAQKKDELDSALEILKRLIKQNKARLIGVFAHNGYGDNGGEKEQDFSTSQANFYAIKQRVALFCKNHKIPLPRFHSLSTTGALRSALQASAKQNNTSDFCPQHKLQNQPQNKLQDKQKSQEIPVLSDSLVRIGIGAYGYHTAEIALGIALKPVLSLWANKISTQTLQKGEKIGYGGATIVAKKSVFSTYDIGYGDGLFRLGANMPRLHCASGEEILPVMSMDCFSCASQKDEICVFDDVSEFATVFGTIPYTILTHLSPFIKRVIV